MYMYINKESGENGEGEKDPLTQQVIGCAIEVHRTLGPGLLESTYEKCLAHELKLAGLPFINQAAIPEVKDWALRRTFEEGYATPLRQILENCHSYFGGINCVGFSIYLRP